MARDAEREPRAWPGPRERRPTEAKHTRRGGLTARPFCKSFLLETALAVDEPRPQRPDGEFFLAAAADVPAAFPADIWRQRSGTPVGHEASGRPRLLTLHGPLTLKTDCRISASLIHTC